MIYLRTYWMLLAVFVVILGYRLGSGQLGSDPLSVETVYSYEQSFQFNAAPGEVKLSAYIARDGNRIEVLDESFDAGSFDLEVEADASGRRILVHTETLSQPVEVSYRARLLMQKRSWTVDPSLKWSDLHNPGGTHLDSTTTVQAHHPRLRNTMGTILGLQVSEGIDDASAWQEAALHQGLLVEPALRAIFEYCHEDLRAVTYSGTTDAITALSLGEASCGGKSRLMAAMCRTLGIPTRLVGGVILGDNERKRTSHVWVECRLARDWVAFDPLNGHFAEVPARYLQLYLGDEPLIQYSRALAFDYSFYSRSERFPRLWLSEYKQHAEASGPSIPLLRQNAFSIILLAPFALLLTVFLRQVVGLESMGVFLPVLLGFSLSQTGWLMGGGQLLLAIVVGTVFRHWLGRLQLLHLPRNAVMITVLVLLFLALSMLTESSRESSRSGAVILPLAALAMTIERYTVMAMDKGHRSAISLMTQTLVIALCCWVVLASDFYRVLVVAYPEIFLLVVAQIILLGNYRGLRLREYWRFRQVKSLTT